MVVTEKDQVDAVGMLVGSADVAMLVQLYWSVDRIITVVEAELRDDAIRDEAADYLDSEVLRYRNFQGAILLRVGLATVSVDQPLAA